MEQSAVVIVKLQEWAALYGLRIIAAVLIFVVGRWIARFLTNMIEKLMKKRCVEATLVSFVGHLLYTVLLIVIIIAALNQLGVQTTSFIAIIGAAGLAIGLALQGSLANFAAGILIIIFHPFKAGDYIEGAGTAGVVESVQMFTTQMKTPDNRTIIVPNAKLTSDNIVNYSIKEDRRLDLVFGVSYADDLQKVRDVINRVLSRESRILPEPAPMVGILELADSSVNFAVRPWVKGGDYWPVRFDLIENMKKAFDAEGISIPFPQTDVHLHKEEEK
ncbi:MAG: mechanosensitive ion channel [Syntrophales bacterium]|jgi:small conductance mechanosensitive channel|nr:mechanosensitive ion channel [Syntrophales bacterium]MDY0044933.1 mechanosensitive ion channel [Syntrophales bacterium]